MKNNAFFKNVCRNGMHKCYTAWIFAVLLWLWATPLAAASHDDTNAASLSAEPAAVAEEPQVQIVQKPFVRCTTSVTGILATSLEVQLQIAESFRIPFLRFNNPLTRNNNVDIKIGTSITPISIEGFANITWTPLAVLKFAASGTVGTGWAIKAIHGLALNRANGSESSFTSVQGKRAYYCADLSATFQFDFGEIFYHPWSHVVMQTVHTASYSGVTGLTDESWRYKNDSGENRNGWRYKGSYFLGYNMPIPMDLIGMQVTTEKTFFSQPKNATTSKAKWGEDRWLVQLDPLVHFSINKNWGITLLARLETERPFANSTDKNTFYQQKEVTNAYSAVKFQKVALVVSFTLPNNYHDD